MDGTLRLEGYAGRPGGKLPKELGGYPADWRLKEVSMEDFPCYPAKRSLLVEPERKADNRNKTL